MIWLQIIRMHRWAHAYISLFPCINDLKQTILQRHRMNQRKAGSKTRTVRFYPKYDSNKPSSPSTKLVSHGHHGIQRTPKFLFDAIFLFRPNQTDSRSVSLAYHLYKITIETQCRDDEFLGGSPADQTRKNCRASRDLGVVVTQRDFNATQVAGSHGRTIVSAIDIAGCLPRLRGLPDVHEDALSS